MTLHRYFGTLSEPCGANDPHIIGATVGIGNRDVRPPLSVMRIAEKVADGANAILDADEQKQLAEIGVDLRGLTNDEINAMVPAMRSAGMDNAAIEWDAHRFRRAVEPVTMRAYFRPARQSSSKFG